jgi:hypothetical protein
VTCPCLPNQITPSSAKVQPHSHTACMCESLTFAILLWNCENSRCTGATLACYPSSISADKLCPSFPNSISKYYLTITNICFVTLGTEIFNDE